MDKANSGLLLVVLGVILVLLSLSFGWNPNLAIALCGPGCYFMMLWGGDLLLLIIGFVFVGIGFWLVSRGTKTHEKVEYAGG